MPQIGTPELITIAIILVILFGGRKLPELGKGLGDAVKELKHSIKSDEKDKE